MSTREKVKPVDRKDTPEHRSEYAKRSNTPWRLGHIKWKGSMARSIASCFKPKGEVK